jgi:FAD/FMN-containing dehydrogenase
VLGLGAWEPAAAASDSRLRELARNVRGPVLTRSSAGYARARLPFNTRYDGVRPLAVVQPVSVRDVQQVVLWARRHRVRLAARSGGHSYAGYSTTSGVVVDLSRLDGVRLSGSVATIGAGARVIDVCQALARRGVAVPLGSCPTIGFGGLALGGGIGLASRRFGTTSDNVVSLDLVTADGRFRTCSARQNADLFWACRGGGGGNFGIVTGFRVRVRRVSNVSWYAASWPWSQADDVVRAWQGFAPDAPDGLFSLCSLGKGTRPGIQSFGQFFGSEAQLRVLLRPLTNVAGASLSTGTSPYYDAQLRWAGCLGRTPADCRTPRRSAFAAKSDYANVPLRADGIDTILRWIERVSGFGSGSLLLDSYGGAINRVRPDATAFVHRDARFSLQYLAYWSGSSAAALAWIRGFYAAMRPHVSGFAYQNYVDPELATWKHAYYGANYARLTRVKRRYDPDFFFRFPQAIPPG